MLYPDNKRSLRTRSRGWPRLLPLIVLAILSLANAAAQPVGGAHPESWLLRNVGARAIGMAGAYTAVVNEPAALHYNPAGLAFLSSRPQITGMYTSLDFGREHNFLAYGQSFDELIGVGVGVNNFVAGSFTGRDASGRPLGDYTNQQLAAQGAFALRTRNIGLGFSAKYLLNSLDGADIKADGWGIDIGLKLQLLDVISIGVAAQNIAGELKWNNDAGTVEKLNYTIRGGVALEFQFNPVVKKTRSNILGDVKTVKKRSRSYALLALDAIFVENDDNPTITLGTEIAPLEVLAFRAGIPVVNDEDGDAAFLPFNAFGLGVSVKVLSDELPFQLQIDYALAKDYVSDKDLSHHLSLIAQF